MPYAINYKFSQTFNVPAEQAYCWCTDFSSDDPKIMAEKTLREKSKN